MPKLVFSKTLPGAQWNTIVFDGIDQRVRDYRDASDGDRTCSAAPWPWPASRRGI